MAVLRLTTAILLATGLGAGEAVHVVRGPWWWHAADGSPHLAMATMGEPLVPPTGRLDDAVVELSGTVAPLENHADGADHVLVLHLARGSAGTLRIQVAGQPVSVHLRQPPAPDAPARVALASGRAWPDRAGLETLGKALGGTPQVVVALGGNVSSRLGTGGWEDTIPVAVVGEPSADLAACTAGHDASWRHGLRVGMLGLPASPERGRSDLAMARDLSPWLVYLDVPAGWDPAVGQRQHSDPADLGVMLAACQRLSVPLALGAGAAGLVSEPLSMGEGGVVRIAADGVRYVLPVPAADDGLAQLDMESALALEQPLLSGLSAELASLQLVMIRPDEADAVRLLWTRAEDIAPDDVATMVKRVVAAESLDQPQIRADILRWSWLPRSELASNLPPVETIVRLRDEGGAQGRALARRLALVAGNDPTIPALPGEADPLVLRDRLLWRIATVRGADAASWRGEAAAAADPLILRALLADVARDYTQLLLPVLVERVRLQALGEMPLDADPLDQHRLFATVFDNVRLSPTPLRPWALALRERADSLARGPIERFLARNGEVRPP